MSSDGQNLTEKHSQAYSDCDVIDNDVIMLKPLSICGKIQKIYMKMHILHEISVISQQKLGQRWLMVSLFHVPKKISESSLTSEIMTSSY